MNNDQTLFLGGASIVKRSRDCVYTSILLGLVFVVGGKPAHSETESVQAPQGLSQSSSCPNISDAKNYDVIVFGDEVPGVMTALQIKQELRSRNQRSRVALITEGDIDKGIGGHLVRGGLAYLDRNQVPPKLRSQYGLFGRPNRLYQQFMGMGRVKTIALDRMTLSQNFKRRLEWKGIDVIGNVELETVTHSGSLICSLGASGTTYTAQQFIDASQGGELAEKSGVPMMTGLEAIGFPNSTLSLGLVLEFYGVTIDQLKAAEANLIGRLLNPNDQEAQKWLAIASGNKLAKRKDMVQSLLDKNRNPKLLYQGTDDSADVRSLAMSIAVHGRLDKEYDLKSSGFLFDRANIAILPDRLSFNALLFYAQAEKARELSNNGAKPTSEMMAIAAEIKTLFEQLGVPRVEIMDELYIRYAGQITHPVDELSATLMTAGGIPASTAIGTFGYHLDNRGGIEGLPEKVAKTSFKTLNFHKMPIFNYGFRHTLPKERQNLAVISPAAGFGGVGTTAGRIVEFNVGVGEGVAIATAIAITEKRPLPSITNHEVRQVMGYEPAIYGERTGSFQAIFSLESTFRDIDYEKDYLSQAQSFLDQQNYVEAIRVLSRAITLETRNGTSYLLRGRSLLSLGLWDYARSDFSQAIQFDPKLTEAYLNRGYLNLFADNYNQAIADFEQVIRIDTKQPKAQFGKQLALSFQRSAASGKDWYAEALPWLNQSVKQQPKFALSYGIRGIVLAKLGDRNAARGDFEKAIALYQVEGNQFSVHSTQRTMEALLLESP